MSSVAESEAFQKWARSLPEDVRVEFEKHLGQQLGAPDLHALQVWAEERMEWVQSLTTFLTRFGALQDPTDVYWALYYAGTSDMLPTLVAEAHDEFEGHEPESDACELCDWMKSKSSVELTSMLEAVLAVGRQEPSQEKLKSYVQSYIEGLQPFSIYYRFILAAESVQDIADMKLYLQPRN